MNNRELIKYYLRTFCSDSGTADERKAQENRVKPLIKKLTGKQGVYKDLPFELLKLEEQGKLLHFLLNETAERQVVANMHKTDADRDFSHFVLIDKDAQQVSDVFLDEFGNYKPLSLNELKQENIDLIRYSKVEDTNLLQGMMDKNELVLDEYMHEIGSFFMMGIALENTSYITDYIDYAASGILQIVIYRILKLAKADSVRIMRSVTEHILSLSSSINFQLNKKRIAQGQMQTLTADTISEYFSCYRTHYSRFQEELNVFDILREEVKTDRSLFCPLQDQYRAEKTLVDENELNLLSDIITEGLPSYNYSQKLLVVRAFIAIMLTFGGRECYPSCPQDIKVYYREIFLSKAKYRNKQASTIVQEYLEKIDREKDIPPFDKLSQYIFVREKISRGYFREKGLLELYFAKADFQKALYNLLVSLYLFYDFRDALEFIYEINRSVLRKLKEELEEGMQ